MIFRFLRGLGGAASTGEGPAEEEAPVEYQGYRIVPAPQKDAAGWRVAARITKEIDGETRTHRLIRADVFVDRGFTVELSVKKARQVIDEQGEKLLTGGD